MFCKTFLGEIRNYSNGCWYSFEPWISFQTVLRSKHRLSLSLSSFENLERESRRVLIILTSLSLFSWWVNERIQSRKQLNFPRTRRKRGQILSLSISSLCLFLALFLCSPPVVSFVEESGWESIKYCNRGRARGVCYVIYPRAQHTGLIKSQSQG